MSANVRSKEPRTLNVFLTSFKMISRLSGHVITDTEGLTLTVQNYLYFDTFSSVN